MLRLRTILLEDGVNPVLMVKNSLSATMLAKSGTKETAGPYALNFLA